MAPKLFVMLMSPPCRAVMMAAKAIDLELEIEEVDKDQLKTPEMLELNPQHTVPILVDDDFVIWDSHAIMGYLIGTYASDDSLYPKEDYKQRALIDQRLHFENGVLFERSKAAGILAWSGAELTDEVKDPVIEAYGFMEAFLEGREWFAGDNVTIADLSILATMTSSELIIPVDPERFPKLTEWLAKAKELPYFDEVNAKGIEALKELIEQASS